MSRVTGVKGPDQQNYRKSRPLRGSAFLCTLPLWFSLVQAQRPDFRCPLQADRPPLTSNFGAYRMNHFHAGIDLGTGNAAGVPVLAAADGRIAQVKASPTGYGKVVYIEHENGWSTVYAHLSEFAPPLDAIARTCQKASGRFAFDKVFKADGPRVRAGDVIGYSGTTGTSEFHLHYEIRKDGLPVNPLTNGFPVADNTPPAVSRVGVFPLSADAHVEGRPEPMLVPVRAGEVTRLAAGGRFGLAVETGDTADSEDYRLAPYEISLRVDGKIVFATRYEQLDYGERAVSELDYLYEIRKDGLPVNPLTNGFPVADNTPPAVSRVGVFPLSADAHVEGRPEPMLVPVRAGEVTRLAAGGRFGLAVETGDTADSEDYRLAPYEISLRVDGKIVFATRYEQLDYGERAVSELDYLYEIREKKLGTFHRLYLYAQPSLFHWNTPAIDTTRWKEGLHKAEIVVRDAAGNSCQTDLSLEVLPALPILPEYQPRGVETAAPLLRGQVSLQGSLLGVTVSADPIIVAASARFPGSSPSSVPCVAFRAKGGTTLQCDVPPSFQGHALLYWQLASGKSFTATLPIQNVASGATLSAPSGEPIARLGPDAVFRDFPSIAWKESAAGARGLPSLSSLYIFEQPWEPLRRRVSITIPTPKTAKSLKGMGVYLLDRGTYWFLDNGKSTTATHLGAFLLLKDTVPPVAGQLRAISLRGRKILTLRYTDLGSGISEAGTTFVLDGRKVIPEPNPATGVIYVYPETPLKKGRHTLQVHLSDRAGNRSARLYRFTIS